MAEIQMVKVPSRIDTHVYDRLSAKTSPAKRARLSRFRQPADAYRTLFADLLVRRLIMQKFGLRNEEIFFAEGPFGKPFVPTLPDFEFSLSHSGDWAVCAADRQAIGVDIERMGSVDLDIARQFFSPEEYDWLMRVDIEERLSLFYELWTIKESFIKMTGKGLQTPLDSFSVRKQGHTFALHQTTGPLPCRVAAYNLDSPYKMAACGLSDPLPSRPVIVMQEELEQHFL